MTALAVVASALLASSSFGTERSLDGFGRVSAFPGWRLVPNDYFFTHAKNEGFEQAAPSPGGPSIVGSFGYNATDHIEVAIDLFAAGEQLRLQGMPAITSVTYGALLALRYQWSGLFSSNLVPYLGIATGPSVVNESNGDFFDERVGSAYVAMAGASWRLGDSWAITFEYRAMYARGVVSPLDAGVNAGGSTFSIGLTTWVAPENPSLAP